MIAGLIFQVVALALFMAAGVEYSLRVWRGRGMRNQAHVEITRSIMFKSFLVGLVLATVAIQARCIYRCAELWGGFNSDLFVNHEATFMVLEGGMIGLAAACLTILHPGLAFRHAWADSNFKFRNKKGAANAKLATRSSSDVDVEEMRSVPQQTQSYNMASK